METSNLGIMGGTFNPIHLGHLMIAEEARQRFHLSQVLFIPAYLPPHKEVDGATAQQRLEMTRLAVADNPYFAVSDMEIRRGGRSYTADTIRLLKEQYGPERVLYFIAGTDTIQDLPNWHHPSYVLESCQFIGASRQMGRKQSIISYAISVFWGPISISWKYLPWICLPQICVIASVMACLCGTLSHRPFVNISKKMEYINVCRRIKRAN